MTDAVNETARGHLGAQMQPIRTLSIVVPAKDEEQSLPVLVARIVEVCASNGLTLRDIVLVDDGSTDKTWAVMTQLAADNATV